MASTFAITKGKGAVPGKAKQRTSTITLTGTYATGGELITAKELGARRIVKAIPTLLASNAVEATPVTSAWAEVQSGGTGIKLKLLNGKTGAELANGVATTGVKVELQSTYY
jgi:hypothetical protein